MSHCPEIAPSSSCCWTMALPTPSAMSSSGTWKAAPPASRRWRSLTDATIVGP